MSLNQSTSTTNGKEEIVVMYPLEDQGSVQSIVNKIEKNNENLPPTIDENPPPTNNYPLSQLLMNLQKNLEESNNKNAKDIKSEIGGLRKKIDESNADMTAKINGLSTTISKNAEEFKKEITRIDKRMDEHEQKNKSMIEKAIAEAIEANNKKRDAERNI